ncbi:ionotropic receptor 75a-like [Belonocnema kinseyi]|uniref:ionotropic receptor 75a-like n=1 Tax=Belonocnema kinseyi TaxID=2817044 RepID=UPI00143D3539|nr:ionotropic receptor 75a-like [Belonocnema kinseyi]
MISIEVLIFLLLIINSRAYDNDFIIDYFIYKEVSSAVGVTCGDENNDIRLIKSFNKNGISATIIKMDSLLISNLTVNSLFWKLGIFLDFKCQADKDIISLFSKASFKYLHSWLILNSNLEETLKLVNDTSFSAVTDFMIAISNNKSYTLYDVFNFCKYRGGVLNVTFAGEWLYKTGINIRLLKDPIAKRSDMHGMTLLMSGLVNDRPKNVKLVDHLQDYDKNKTVDILGKYTYILWLHVSDMYNFTIEPGEFTEWKLGDKNGPMIAALGRREIDLAGTPAQITDDRLNYISSPTSPWPFRTCFMFLTTPSKDIKINEFLSPFTTECWYLTIFLILLGSLSFGFLLVKEDIPNEVERYSDSFLIPIGSLCQQGSALCPTHTAGRIGFLSVMIFSLLMYNYYSASVVSARLNEPLAKMNDSIVSLTKSNLKIGVEKQIYFMYFLQKNDWETNLFRARFLSLPESKRWFPSDEGIKRIIEGNFAYHIDPNIAYPIIERTFDNRQICQLTEVNFVHTTHMPFFVSKDSPFLEMATRGMAKMYSTGIRQRQLNRWRSRVPLCRKDIMVVDSITIYETAPALILLTFGIIISAVLCIAENIELAVCKSDLMKP